MENQMFIHFDEKDIPLEKDDPRYKKFWENEKLKVERGVNIDGFQMSGFLYFHCNHWRINADEVTEWGETVPKSMVPQLRDNELIINDLILEAEKTRKGICIMGLRQFSKTTIQSSYAGRAGVIYRGSQNLLMGTSKDDLNNLTQYLDFGLLNCSPYFRVPRITRDWSDERVLLGIKRKNNDNVVYSQYVIRNTTGGKSTEKAAGVSNLKCNIWDEALINTSILYKEDGICTIGDCKIGDKIYDDSGKLTTILEKYPQGEIDIYRITLHDGRTVDCSLNHLWTVLDNHSKKYRTITTEKLIEGYKRTQLDWRYDNKVVNKYRYFIPKNKCLQYPEKKLLIDPYYLGLWLGDGLANNVNICSMDEEIIEYCVNYSKELKLDYTIKVDEEKANGNFKYITIHNNWKTYNPLRDAFKKYNLLNNKHIPDEYLVSSREQRLELLKGLMDTDGTVYNIGTISISSSYPNLAKGIETLIRSLGIKCISRNIETQYKNKDGIYIKCRNALELTLFTDELIFKLPRKLNKQKQGIEKNKNHKKAISYKNFSSIIDIQYIGKGEATCIKVDNESKLFLTEKFIPTHNCGKDDFLAAFVGSKPAMLGEFGWRCIPLIMGTGGNVVNARDARQVFFNPEAHNLLSEVQPDGRVTGIFLSGEYRADCKYKTSLAEYLIEQGKLKDIPKDSELWRTEIKVSNKELAREKIKKELDAFLNSGDVQMYNKWKMYYPMTVDEVFLSDSNNNFPVDVIKAHKNQLEQHYEPLCVDLYRDVDNKVVYKESHLKPISKFPVGPKDIKEAPVVIYEPPIEGLPFGTYVVGFDEYNENESSDRVNSLGTAYVFKRMYTPLGEYQSSIVASYAGRCKEVKDFHKLMLDLTEYYNALGLPENEGKSLIQYFFLKNKGHLLLESQELAKQINPLTLAKRNKGLSASTPNQRYYMNLMVEYTKEEIYMLDKDGEETIKLGCFRIPDPMLLAEMIEYKSKPSSSRGIHDGNYDRIISFGLALTIARYLDIAAPITNFDIKTLGQKQIEEGHHKSFVSPFIGIQKAPLKINNPFIQEVRKLLHKSPFTGLK